MESKVISCDWSEFCAAVDRSITKCDFRRALNLLLLKREGPLTVDECRMLMSIAKDVPEDKRKFFINAFVHLKDKGFLPDLEDVEIKFN